jgi:hypothetical protein
MDGMCGHTIERLLAAAGLKRRCSENADLRVRTSRARLCGIEYAYVRARLCGIEYAYVRACVRVCARVCACVCARARACGCV